MIPVPRVVSAPMMHLFVMFMFLSESFELLNDLIIPADLLLDDKQQGIDREHGSQNDSHNFSFHTKPPF
jgi:hypothetical protein